MSKRKLAAGNWKMNGRTVNLTEALSVAAANPEPSVDILICPPATLISPMASAMTGTAVHVGGQDCHAAEKGAHTGDIAASMLTDAGASYVILGHSERRADHGESSTAVADKVRAAWEAGLVAVVCIGETEAQRDAGQTLEVIGTQLLDSLPFGANGANTVIAYEPVWAIGTGRTPSMAEVEEVHGFLHMNAPDPAIRLLYGGSVNPKNASDIFAVPYVDGALVGGASLKAEDFNAIIAALEEA